MSLFSPYHRKVRPDRVQLLLDIDDDQAFVDLVRDLAGYFTENIRLPYTIEQLRTDEILLQPLVRSLQKECHHPHLVSALMVLKSHFNDQEHEDRGVTVARGYACEVVAWRFAAHLSEHDLLEHLLSALPAPKRGDERDGQSIRRASRTSTDTDETTTLLDDTTSTGPSGPRFSKPYDEDPTLHFVGLNALEIAAIADAKKFVSQPVVQKIVNALWNGDIIFWDSMSSQTKKKAQKYNKWKTDVYCRLRVPKYQKAFETFFIGTLLALYYAVLREIDRTYLTPVEILLYVWIAAYAYEEFGELNDSGSLFYIVDLWNLLDMCIVLIGIVFLITRTIGLINDNAALIRISFDILSSEAILLWPRAFSLLSLTPFFGTLIPSLKAMTRDFVKFLGVVLILYLGFFTTFTILGRDTFTMKQISWILIYVFNGSGYMGLDSSSRISHAFGPTLMVLCVIATNILLLPALIVLLSNSMTNVMGNAREEFLFQYSVFVLEASASRRLTYYFPPLNLIPLICFRPLRLFLPADRLRTARIVVLKATHFPFVGVIWAYESVSSVWSHHTDSWQSTRYRSHKLHFARQLAEPLPKSTMGGRSRKMAVESLPPQRPLPLALDDQSGSVGTETLDELRSVIVDLTKQVRMQAEKLEMVANKIDERAH